MDINTQAYVWLAHAKISPQVVEKLLYVYKTPENLFYAFAEAEQFYLSPAQAQALTQSKHHLSKTLDDLQKHDVSVLTMENSNFPKALQGMPQQPYVLFYKGNLEQLQKPSVAIVGTRHPIYYGKKIAKSLATQLSEQNINVISGFAIGIDAYAHDGASQAKGGTTAICGCGLDVDYPSANAKLKQRILENNGLLISEYTCGIQPVPYHFPHRNRIIAALCDALVFAQGFIKSGGMLTVDKALEIGKPIFAVPGNIDNALSEGPNYLISKGYAKCYTQVDDILEELNLSFTPSHAEPEPTLGLDAFQQAVYHSLQLSERSFDELVELHKKPADDIQLALGYLEIMGLVQKVAGNIYHTT